MTKEAFIQLGLDEETAKQCEAASLKELKAYVPKTQFDQLSQDKTTLETTKTTLEGQLETLKTTHATQLHEIKVEQAVELALGKVQAINGKAIRPFLEGLDKAELLEDGTVKGLEDQLKALKKGADTKFLFASEPGTQFRGMRPGESGKEPGDHKVDVSKMTYPEFTAYLEANPDVTL